MTKTDKYWVNVARLSNKVHMSIAYSYGVNWWPATDITEILKEFRRIKKKRLFSCEIYRDKTCVYRYNIIASQDWKDAIKRAFAKPCKRLSVFMELADGSGAYITVERRKHAT